MKDSRGAIVIQDPFQLDFCVTSAYNTQAWKNHCKYVSRSIFKGFDKNSRKEKLADFFENIPKIVQKQVWSWESVFGIEVN